MPCLTWATSICLKCNISCKKNFFKCRTKNIFFGYFFAGTRKSYCTVVFYTSVPWNFFQTEFCPKIKILKFGDKIVLVGYFGLEFQKTNVEFEISILEFVKKNLNLGPKIPYLGIFGLQFNKIYYQVFNQHTQIWETIKFYPNFYPSFKFETKHALFGSLAGMLKNYCDICNQRPPNCLIAKFRTKIRILKFGIKNALFGCFRPQFWKTIVIFEINTLEFPLFCAKNKNSEIWDQKCQISVFCGWNLKTLMSYLKSASSNLSCCKVWCKNENA